MNAQRWEQPPQTYVTVDGRRRGLWRDSDGFMHEHPLPVSVSDGRPPTDRAWLETEFICTARMQAAMAAAQKAAADASGRFWDRAFVWGIMLLAAAWVASVIVIVWAL